MTDELILSIIFPAILFIISFMGKIKAYWRNKAANAFFVVGQHAKTKEERIWGYRNSLLAGNEKAEKYIFEFKLNGSAEAALEQINEKEYLTPYLLDGRQLVKIGADFNKETRNIGKYLVEM